MRRKHLSVAALAAGCSLFVAGLAGASATAEPVEPNAPNFKPGAPGGGDPYFPTDGNGGYNVNHYRVEVTYDPDTNFLSGETTIWARATQDLSRFNLDLDGLDVDSATVGSRAAKTKLTDGELTITPTRGIPKRHPFVAVVEYSGVPSGSGFHHTDDGAIVMGQPHAAASWFPVNDHPRDKASYTFEVTAPSGLEVISNGRLLKQEDHQGWTSWTWRADVRMASYLAMTAIGEFDVDHYEEDGIEYWDAFDPQLFEPLAEPRTGDQLALSQMADTSYKRLSRTISVPDDGATLSYWVTRDTEANWDFTFVEAHTVGQDDWTTLPDQNGHTTQEPGSVCPYWFDLHPFLAHYQTADGETCSSTGSSGEWWAASGASDGYEQWTVDLSAYAGEDVEVSISSASDDLIQRAGVFVDDIEVSTGDGTTSFEADGNPLDGWVASGAPVGSEPNENDWIVGTVDDVPPPPGPVARGSVGRSAEVIGFLSEQFGPYPFEQAGGIVDPADFSSALETQTRPIYAPGFFSDSERGDSVVAHELAHQWFGDSLTLAQWKDIWLHEGFASYAEWLWSEHEGLGTAQEIFDELYQGIPADDDFWHVTVADPGADNIFHGAVYDRGAMTLHQLRVTVGDDVFFEILQGWAASQRDSWVTTEEFIAYAEQISGQQLDDLFEAWVYTPEKPQLPAGQSRPSAAGESPARLPRPAGSIIPQTEAR